MKKKVKKQFWLSVEEAEELKQKANKCCLSEASLIRLILKGYEPKEKPDENFYKAMRELTSISNNINQLTAKANSLGFIDTPMLKAEVLKWNKFQLEISRYFLKPNKSDLKWQ